MPVKDRLRIVESLWNSIDADTPVSIPPEQREDISRRIERHKYHPDELLTWEQVLDGLEIADEVYPPLPTSKVSGIGR